MPEAKSLRVWDASECVLMFIDYQDHVMDLIFAQDRRILELNVRTLAKMAVAFKVPVILSTVGVEMGVNGPTIASLRAVLPNVQDIDRTSMNAWADAKFVAAVKGTGRKRLVMCGISTSACLTYPVVSALADGSFH
jgi:nicotinamidase-related amidase